MKSRVLIWKVVKKNIISRKTWIIIDWTSRWLVRNIFSDIWAAIYISYCPYIIDVYILYFILFFFIRALEFDKKIV